MAISPAAQLDMGRLFEALPSPYMVLDRTFSYVEANAAYCRVVDRRREDLIGVNLFDAFPNDGEAGRQLRASFERVLDTGRPDTLAFIRYEIAGPDGVLEERYWTAVHTPMLAADGAVAFIIQNTVDVTELRQASQVGDSALAKQTALFERNREMQAAHDELLDQSEWLRDLFMQAPGFMAVLVGPEHRFAMANAAYRQLVGDRADLLGKPVAEALPEVTEQGFVELLGRVYRSGEPFVGLDVPVALRRGAQADLEQRYVDFIYQPVRNVAGQVTGIFVQGADVTERVVGRERQKLLLDELNHRVKNNLATVQSIAAQTMRWHPEPAVFREAFDARLAALSASHDLLTRSQWDGADLRSVLQHEVSAYGERRFVLTGPPVALDARETLTLGLIAHELATNAAKYGALSNPEGCVRIDWSVEDAAGGPQLNISWREEGGPPVVPPTRQGFGTKLIQRSARQELSGQASVDYAPSGLVYRLVAPLAARSAEGMRLPQDAR